VIGQKDAYSNWPAQANLNRHLEGENLTNFIMLDIRWI